MARVKREPKSIASFTIITEGDETEPRYFQLFRQDGKSIRVNPNKRPGSDNQPKCLKKLAEKIIIERSFVKGRDHLWIVLDKDDNTKEDLSALREWCRSNDVGLAFSNPMFEYWLAIHFQYIECGMNKEILQNILTKGLGRDYRKNETYPEFGPKVPDAIRNAKRERSEIQSSDLCVHNPLTTVDKLIEDLMSFGFSAL